MQGSVSTGNQRRFLFLQGPHGPFFAALAVSLEATGAQVWRVGFNRGDEMFWRGPRFLPFHGAPENWSGTLDDMIAEHAITDLVCYGSSRPIHKVARARADAAGLTMHVFEEGYLRPYWITYERGGANADSAAAGLTLAEMAAALTTDRVPLAEPVDGWGDMRAHMFWGAAYHAFLLAGSGRYPRFRPHRTPGVWREFRLHAHRLVDTPLRAARRWSATLRTKFGGFPYHLVLLQLAHDANFRDHGPFRDQASFLDVVLAGFATGAPPHHHLVLKAHPLEDGREPLRPLIRRLTAKHGLQGRVHFITGGKLARLLDTARSAVTVNSTAAEQALWRGLPLKAFGEAVFNRPEFVSPQPIADFFRTPQMPDRNAYLIYRSFLLATSQIPGGFYALRNRRKLLRQLPDLMLARQSPTERLLAARSAAEASPQHIRVVS
jgi:capsular polysaccharide export protein